MKKMFLLLVFFSSLSCTFSKKKHTNLNDQNLSREVADIVGDDDRIHIHKSPLFKTKFGLSSVVLSLINEEHPDGRNYCSGTLFNHSGVKYLITNEHCISSQKKCRETKITQNYSDHAVKSKYLENNPIETYFRDTVFLREKFPKALLSSRQSPIYQCNKLILSNYLLDFAIARISSPLNTVNVSEEAQTTLSLANDTSDNTRSNMGLTVIGNPGGNPTKVSPNCKSEELFIDSSGAILNDSYSIKMDCDIEGGNSGGMVIDTSTNKYVGIVSSGINKHIKEADLGVLNFKKANYFVDFSLIKKSIVEFLDGNNGSVNSGIWNHSQTEWSSIDGKYLFITPLDQENDDQTQAFIQKLVSLLDKYFTGLAVHRLKISTDPNDCSELYACITDKDHVLLEKLKKQVELTKTYTVKRRY